MKRVNVYYTTIKPSDQDEPNYRAYYISRWIGEPFMTFDLPTASFELEQITVATYLGLKIDMIEWHKNRGSK